MKHYLANVTWRCQNRCSYCWMQKSVSKRPELTTATERPMMDWVEAIHRDHVDILDIAGGEPLLLDWIPDLIRACPATQFGLSTNGLSGPGIARLAKARPYNLLGVNVSYHPETLSWNADYHDRYAEALNTLRSAGVNVHANVVNAPGVAEGAAEVIEKLRAAGVSVVVNPDERVEDLGILTDTPLECDGGITHLTVAPDGTAWPCLTTLRSPYWAEMSVGNWLDNTIDLSRKPVPCRLKCVDYYVLKHEHSNGDMWGINAREVPGK